MVEEEGRECEATKWRDESRYIRNDRWREGKDAGTNTTEEWKRKETKRGEKNGLREERGGTHVH